MLKIVFLFVLFSFPAFAEGGEEWKPDLKTQAVDLAVQVDAYNYYCGAESRLHMDLIEKLIESGRASKHEILRKRSEVQYKHALNRLREDGKSCEDIEFMLKRLEVMRKLRDISYQLNGVAPEDIPKDNVPDLENLLPPRSSEL